MSLGELSVNANATQVSLGELSVNENVNANANANATQVSLGELSGESFKYFQCAANCCQRGQRLGL